MFLFRNFYNFHAIFTKQTAGSDKFWKRKFRAFFLNLYQHIVIWKAKKWSLSYWLLVICSCWIDLKIELVITIAVMLGKISLRWLFNTSLHRKSYIPDQGTSLFFFHKWKLLIFYFFCNWYEIFKVKWTGRANLIQFNYFFCIPNSFTSGHNK